MDGGKLEWGANAKRFPQMNDPGERYHGLRFWDTFGPFALAIRAILEILRALNMAMNLFAAYGFLLGAETLSWKCERHAENALNLARWLRKHDNVCVNELSWIGEPSVTAAGEEISA